MRLVIFGVSNMLGDIFDCALALGLTPSLVVMNVPEITRPRTRSVTDRIMRLPTPPRIVQYGRRTGRTQENLAIAPDIVVL